MKKNYDDKYQYLVNEQGKPVSVLISIKKYEKIMQELEDCRDAIIADEAYEEFTRGRSLEESIIELLQRDEN